VRIFVNQLAERQFILASINIEQTLLLLVHKKIIHLPLTYRLNMKRGSLYAVVNNEIKAIASFVISGSSIFSTPACLIAVQLLIIYEFRLFGLVITFCIVIGSITQLILAYLMHDSHWRKIIIHSERIGFNVEFLNSMRDLKLLGWEDLMVKKNI
jgi:ABC-type bacteriocin/lantibiotic exporter with double-glycine peptidase domain